MSRFACLTALVLGLTATAAAAQSLPTTTRGEAQAQGIGRSLESQGQIRGIQQQNQFETNQIRGDIMRSQTMPPPPAVGGGIVAPTR